MASLLDQWKKKNEARQTPMSSILQAPADADIPLSHGQKQLWFLQQLYPDNPFYNYCEAYVFHGKLNTEHFEKALGHVLDTHDILKSIYFTNENGRVLQKVKQSLDLNLTFYDLSAMSEDNQMCEIDKLALSDASTNFSLTDGPLYKFSLIKCSEDTHYFFVTFNHLVTDKWSMMVFRNDLATYYNQLKNDLPFSSLRPEIQYADYSFHQSKLPIKTEQLDFWKKELKSNNPYMPLPFDFERPNNPSFKGNLHVSEYSEELSKDILSVAKKMQSTPYMVILAAYYILLHKLSSNTSIAVGSPVANRNERELENLMGFFNDTIVLQTEVNPEESFSGFISKVKKTSLAAFENKDIPFGILVKELKPERKLNLNPFFQVMFIYHKVPDKPSFGDDLHIEHKPSEVGVAKFDLTLYIAEEGEKLSSTIEYAFDLFKEDTIIQFQEQLKLILLQLIEDQEIKISDIKGIQPAVTPNEKNETEIPVTSEEVSIDPHINGIHSIIENIAAQLPNDTALTFKNESITYKELIERSNAIAQKILEKTKDENQIVGLCIDRSLEMVIGLLGILQAGCAYLPIDPEYPKKRIRFMISDAKVNYILSESKHISLFEDTDSEILLWEDCKDFVADHALPTVNNEDLAYVIYTSGSTGKPKGVPIRHKNIITSTLGRFNFYENQPSAFLLLSSIAFDSSKAGLFWSLCSGANLVISEKRLEQDIEELSKIIKAHKVSHTLMLPTLYNLILSLGDKSNLETLNTVIVAGEACPVSTVQKHFERLPQTRLYNEYGPTEATVWCIAHLITPEDAKTSIPIGKAVANAQIYLLDERLNPVRKGETGQIYIGGPGLSNTYMNRPDLTEEAYIKNPFSENSTSKLYKTGDLGRYREDDNLEFLGRVDQQVKIRGHRIEIDEIERVLISNDNVKEAVVLIEDSNTSADEVEIRSASKKLVAYLTTHQETDSTSDILSFVQSELPRYMVPSKLNVISEIPRLPNGKIDKNTLKTESKPSRNASIAIEDEQIYTGVEGQLVQIWEEVLKIKPIHIEDNFFEIGGDSILSIQVVSKARKEGISISPNQLFEHQTIKEITKSLSSKNEKIEFITPIRKEGDKKPLFCIHSGGGHVFFYGLLKHHLKEGRPIYAINPTGTEGEDVLHKDVEQMAEQYLKSIRKIQPHGPYNILVYCFSVSVGNEMAIQLKGTGEEINIIAVDTMASAWDATGPEAMKARTSYFVNNLMRKPFRTIKLFFQERYYLIEPTMVKVFGKRYQKELEKLKANLRKISVGYKWYPHNGKVSLILTEKNDANFEKFMIDSWKKYAKGGVTVLKTEGFHTTLFEESNIAFVSEKIDESIM